MADVFSVRKRSAIMRGIKCRNTKPELIVRSVIHKMGYRFRVHQGVLPGNPDIVLKRYKKVIFVNGCFWHGHAGCKRAELPASNQVFWKNKISGNVNRDKLVLRRMKKLGWESLVIWSCRVKDKEKITKTIDNFLSLG